MVNITAIVVIVVLVIIIVIMIVYALRFRSERQACEGTESPYCLSINCPCDNNKTGPCFGYASRPGPSTGTFYCSNAPGSLVNASGQAV